MPPFDRLVPRRQTVLHLELTWRGPDLPTTLPAPNHCPEASHVEAYVWRHQMSLEGIYQMPLKSVNDGKCRCRLVVTSGPPPWFVARSRPYSLVFVPYSWAHSLGPLLGRQHAVFIVPLLALSGSRCLPTQSYLGTTYKRLHFLSLVCYSRTRYFTKREIHLRTRTKPQTEVRSCSAILLVHF